ncbi:MAG: hypothetical protein WBB34_16245 [Xanthobacteraceae bacterium]
MPKTLSIIVACTVSAILPLFQGTGIARAQPWNNIPNLSCADAVTSDHKFTENTPKVLTWLKGYWDGMGALSALDPRMEALRKMDFSQLSSLVLVYCAGKPDQTVGEAVTDVSAMILFMQPGVPFHLSVSSD